MKTLYTTLQYFNSKNEDIVITKEVIFRIKTYSSEYVLIKTTTIYEKGGNQETTNLYPINEYLTLQDSLLKSNTVIKLSNEILII